MHVGYFKFSIHVFMSYLFMAGGHLVHKNPCKSGKVTINYAPWPTLYIILTFPGGSYVSVVPLQYDNIL